MIDWVFGIGPTGRDRMGKVGRIYKPRKLLPRAVESKPEILAFRDRPGKKKEQQ